MSGTNLLAEDLQNEKLLRAERVPQNKGVRAVMVFFCDHLNMCLSACVYVCIPIGHSQVCLYQDKEPGLKAYSLVEIRLQMGHDHETQGYIFI